MTNTERREARYQRRKLKRESKEIHKTYDDVFIFDNLWNSYRECIKGVKWKRSTQCLEKKPLTKITKLFKQLKEEKFKSRGFYEFDIFERGKKRHIKSVHIEERVVQKCLCREYLIPVLSRQLIYDNSASQKGKGIDFSRNRFYTHLRQFYRENGREGYALVYDFSNFFDSIDHDILKEKLKKDIKDERVSKITNYFIDTFGERGLGLGSETSQILALYYPTSLDRAIKEKLKIKQYGRYMDDGYLLNINKKRLAYCLEHIKEETNKLNIRLNLKKTTVIKLTKGIVWLKWNNFILKRGRILKKPNRKSIIIERRKLKKLVAKLYDGRITTTNLQNSITSWQGYMKRTNGRRSIFNTLEIKGEWMNGNCISERII